MLQKESELYGAMDGAMKFVKGDVIASIIIAFVNIVGGLIIGVGMHKMSLGQAARVYTILSIGDGLVAQIPSLIISLTAGLVTTRISSDRKDANLGREIAGQLLKEPRAIFIASGAVFGLGLLKGFPLWSFSLLALGLLVAGIAVFRTKKKEAAKGVGLAATGATGDSEGHAVVAGGVDNFALTLPVILELGKYLSQLVNNRSKGSSRLIEDLIPKMRAALYQDMGIRYPGVHVTTDSTTLGFAEYAILLNEVPVIRGKVLEKHVLTNETEQNLQRYNIPFVIQKGAFGLPSVWVNESFIPILDKAAITYWKPLEVTILHLSYFFRQTGQEFLGIQEMRAMLEFMERAFPDLVKEVTRLVPLQKLTEIFRRLVQEQVSIKDLRTIMEALSEWAQTEKDTVLLTEYVRSSLKRYITNKYSQGKSTISVYLLDPEIEEMVRGAVKQTSAGSYLALDPDSIHRIMRSMRQTIVPVPPGGQPAVLLTAIDVRRFVKKLIESEYPDIAVISYQEILPEVRIQPLGRVQLG